MSGVEALFEVPKQGLCAGQFLLSFRKSPKVQCHNPQECFPFLRDVPQRIIRPAADVVSRSCSRFQDEFAKSRRSHQNILTLKQTCFMRKDAISQIRKVDHLPKKPINFWMLRPVKGTKSFRGLRKLKFQK